MRILLVTGLVAGGVGKHVEQLARGLRARGHQVAVAAPAPVAAQFGLGEPFVELPVGDRPHPLRDRRALATLGTVMRGADVVHAHGLRAGALAALARRGRTHPRLVVTTHNGPPGGRAAQAVYAVMEQVVARGADLVLGVSPDLVARADRAGAPRTALAVVPATPSATLATRGGTAPDRAEVRRRVRDELGLGDDRSPRLVVNAGRLARQKGQDTLVEAYLQVLRAWPDRQPPVLVIAGEGPERAALESRVATAHEDAHVRLLGHRDDVPDLLAAADLVVSSARWEGQPVWLQEALQQGAPVVATDVGGTGVLLADGAVLVPATGAGATEVAGRLATAMTRVLLDDALAADLRARATRRAAELPDEGDAVEAALAAYRPGPGEPTAPTTDPVT